MIMLGDLGLFYTHLIVRGVWWKSGHSFMFFKLMGDSCSLIIFLVQL